jgi:hypothetical protein
MDSVILRGVKGGSIGMFSRADSDMSVEHSTQSDLVKDPSRIFSLEAWRMSYVPLPSGHRDIAHVGGLVDLGGIIVAMTPRRTAFRAVRMVRRGMHDCRY